MLNECFSSSPSESVEMNLRKNKNTIATVENLFRLSSNANNSWVTDTVLKAIINDKLIASFNGTCDLWYIIYVFDIIFDARWLL